MAGVRDRCATGRIDGGDWRTGIGSQRHQRADLDAIQRRGRERTVGLCSRNDAIGNVAVIGAAALVGIIGRGWPDLVVTGLMAGLFLSSALQILKRGLQERDVPDTHDHAGHDH